ncbi:unnamed protein product [Closterium sp. Naga37s-1]|nr:unnamed protein product [Closterium sp. Naga37s-1]
MPAFLPPLFSRRPALQPAASAPIAAPGTSFRVFQPITSSRSGSAPAAPAPAAGTQPRGPGAVHVARVALLVAVAAALIACDVWGLHPWNRGVAHVAHVAQVAQEARNGQGVSQASHLGAGEGGKTGDTSNDDDSNVGDSRGASSSGAVEYRGAPWKADMGRWLLACGDQLPPVTVGEALCSQACPGNCSGNGVCNHELGECRCRHGFSGPDCSQLHLHQCNLPASPEWPVGTWVASICPAHCDTTTALCFCGNGTRFPHRPITHPCGFVYRNHDFVYSEVDTDLLFHAHTGYCNADPRVGFQRDYTGCGMCDVDGYLGPFCDVRVESFCLNQCSLHGTCHRGYCECSHGFFGIDCSVPSASLLDSLLCPDSLVYILCPIPHSSLQCSHGFFGIDCSVPSAFTPRALFTHPSESLQLDSPPADVASTAVDAPLASKDGGRGSRSSVGDIDGSVSTPGSAAGNTPPGDVPSRRVLHGAGGEETHHRLLARLGAAAEGSAAEAFAAAAATAAATAGAKSGWQTRVVNLAAQQQVKPFVRRQWEQRRGKAAVGSSSRRWVRRRRPLIYIYDLPGEFTFHHMEARKIRAYCTTRLYGMRNETLYNHFQLYGMEVSAWWEVTSQVAVLESLLASPHRTINASAADYFFVPVLGACITARADDSPATSMQGIMLSLWGNTMAMHNHCFPSPFLYLSYLQTSLRDEGTFPWDEGACSAPGDVFKGIILSYWGNTMAAHNHHHPLPSLTVSPCITSLTSICHPCPACRPFPGTRVPAVPLKTPVEQWKRLFFFGGNLGLNFSHGRPEANYSMGIRQRVALYFASQPNRHGHVGLLSRPDVLVLPGPVPDYALQLSQARFCGVFPGDGFSARMEDKTQFHSLSSCPVSPLPLPTPPPHSPSPLPLPTVHASTARIIALLRGVPGGWLQCAHGGQSAAWMHPLYHPVRIAEADIPNLVTVLNSFSSRQVRAMQRAASLVWMRWFYRSAVLLEAGRQRVQGKDVGEWVADLEGMEGDDALGSPCRAANTGGRSGEDRGDAPSDAKNNAGSGAGGSFLKAKSLDGVVEDIKEEFRTDVRDAQILLAAIRAAVIGAVENIFGSAREQAAAVKRRGLPKLLAAKRWHQVDQWKVSDVAGNALGDQHKTTEGGRLKGTAMLLLGNQDHIRDESICKRLGLGGEGGGGDLGAMPQHPQSGAAAPAEVTYDSTQKSPPFSLPGQTGHATEPPLMDGAAQPQSWTVLRWVVAALYLAATAVFCQAAGRTVAARLASRPATVEQFLEFAIPEPTPENVRLVREQRWRAQAPPGLSVVKWRMDRDGRWEKDPSFVGETAWQDQGSLDRSTATGLLTRGSEDAGATSSSATTTAAVSAGAAASSSKGGWRERLQRWEEAVVEGDIKDLFEQPSSRYEYVYDWDLIQAQQEEEMARRARGGGDADSPAVWLQRRWWKHRPGMPYVWLLHKIQTNEVDAAVFSADMRRLYVTMKDGFPAEFKVDIPIDPFLYPSLLLKGVNVDMLPRSRLFFLRGVAALLPSLLLLGGIGAAQTVFKRRVDEKIHDYIYMDRSQLLLPEDVHREGQRSAYDDVVMADDIWEVLEEVMAYMRDPMLFHSQGIKLPRGILISGPPGTGKTLLARSIARECGLPFVFTSGAEFVDSTSESGLDKVFNIFFTARANAPAFLFVDEIDALAGKSVLKDPERRDVYEEFLAELDGEEEHTDVDRFSLRQSVILIAATNRPDELDEGLTKAGRIDREIHVGLPSEEQRIAIFGVHSRNRLLAPSVDFSKIHVGLPSEEQRIDGNVDSSKVAFRMIGFSGADIRNLVNEEGIMAVRRGHTVIEQTQTTTHPSPSPLPPGGLPHNRVLRCGYPQSGERGGHHGREATPSRPKPQPTPLETPTCQVAFRTIGFSGADIRNLVNEAGIMAVRRGHTVIEQGDVVAALDKQLFESLGISMTDDEQQRLFAKVPAEVRRVLAVHEAGHVLLSHLFPAFDWHAFTHILPGGQERALSVFYPRQEMLLKGSTSVGYLHMQMVVAHGGMCAERLVFGDDHVTDNGQDDLMKLSQIAREIASSHANPRFGLLPITMHPIMEPPGFPDEVELIPSSWTRPGTQVASMSVEMSEIFTREVTWNIELTERMAMDALRRNRAVLDRITDHLVEHFRISGLEAGEIVHSMQPQMLPDLLEPETEAEAAQEDAATATPPDWNPEQPGRYQYLDIYPAPLHRC